MAKTNYDMFSSYEILDNLDPLYFTRCDLKTGSYSLLDGFLISKNLRNNVNNFRISHSGSNVSDHSPVEFELLIPLLTISKASSSLPQYVNWKKLTAEQKLAYQNEMSRNLNNINAPYDSILHGNTCCTNDSHKLCLENYYCDLINAVTAAESILPKTRPKCQRSFWTDELTELKRDSVKCDNYWRSIGSPRQGPAFECKKKCHFLYKSALCKEKRKDAREKNDSLHADLANKNGTAFWKTWKSLNNKNDSLSTRVNGETDGPAISDTFATYFESVYANHNTFEHNQLKNKFVTFFSDYYLHHIDDDISPYLIS